MADEIEDYKRKSRLPGIFGRARDIAQSEGSRRPSIKDRFNTFRQGIQNRRNEKRLWDNGRMTDPFYDMHKKEMQDFNDQQRNELRARNDRLEQKLERSRAQAREDERRRPRPPSTAVRVGRNLLGGVANVWNTLKQGAGSGLQRVRDKFSPTSKFPSLEPNYLGRGPGEGISSSSKVENPSTSELLRRPPPPITSEQAGPAKPRKNSLPPPVKINDEANAFINRQMPKARYNPNPQDLRNRNPELRAALEGLHNFKQSPYGGKFQRPPQSNNPEEKKFTHGFGAFT